MGTLNNFDPIFFYLTLGKSATGGAFDGVVTPSATETTANRTLLLAGKNLKPYQGLKLESLREKEESGKMPEKT